MTANHPTSNVTAAQTLDSHKTAYTLSQQAAIGCLLWFLWDLQQENIQSTLQYNQSISLEISWASSLLPNTCSDWIVAATLHAKVNLAGSSWDSLEHN